MNTEVINEGNRLIAEFMGGKFYENTPTILEITIISPAGNTIKYIDKLKYHSSWDWLMPVVEKIQSIDITPAPNYKGYRIEIVLQGYVKITGFPMPQIFTNVSIEGSLIIAAWKTVIQFIKYQNEARNHF